MGWQFGLKEKELVKSKWWGFPSWSVTGKILLILAPGTGDSDLALGERVREVRDRDSGWELSPEMGGRPW